MSTQKTDLKSATPAYRTVQQRLHQLRSVVYHRLAAQNFCVGQSSHNPLVHSSSL